jgi:SAM-dependent methyltransferase
LDISLNLLKIAKNRLGDISVVRADMRHLPFRQEIFAAATSVDTSFGYLATEDEDLQSLKELQQTLKHNGTLIIDVFNREQLIRKYTEKSSVNPKEREYPSFFLSQKRTIDKSGSTLRDSWTARDKSDGKIRVFTHLVRLYPLKVLQDLLKKADFRVDGVYGDYDGKKFSPESNRLILVASAK